MIGYSGSADITVEIRSGGCVDLKESVPILQHHQNNDALFCIFSIMVYCLLKALLYIFYCVYDLLRLSLFCCEAQIFSAQSPACRLATYTIKIPSTHD